MGSILEPHLSAMCAFSRASKFSRGGATNAIFHGFDSRLSVMSKNVDEVQEFLEPDTESLKSAPPIKLPNCGLIAELQTDRHQPQRESEAEFAIGYLLGGAATDNPANDTTDRKLGE